jgi:hypothetical protein
MADSAAFEWTCTELEQISSLDRLEARGTVRLALKQSGLEARNVSPDQMKVVLEKVLPGELETRGIDGAAGLCSSLLPGLAAVVADATPGEMPDEIFRRLGGS